MIFSTAGKAFRFDTASCFDPDSDFSTLFPLTPTWRSVAVGDKFKFQNRDIASPSDDFFEITPDDGADLSEVVRQIYVGTGGDLTIVSREGTEVPLVGVPSGSWVGPAFIARVKATGTTASDLVGFI